MIDYFVYNGVSSAAYSARVFPTRSMLRAPAHKYNKVTVPGRSGALLMDLASYDNIQREYDVQIANDSDLAAFDALRNYLASCTGYLRLTDSFDTAHYYMAAYTEAFDMDADWRSKKRGRGTVTFDCMPQRFLLSGETVQIFTASGTIENPTLFPAKPLLRVYGNGTVGVGSTNITIVNTDVYTDIDCAMGYAYKGGSSKNLNVSLSSRDFPSLAAGETGISLGTGITRVEVTPRWWTV